MQGTIQKWYQNTIIALKEENVVGRTDMYTPSRRQNIKSTINRSVKIIGAEEVKKLWGHSVGKIINVDVKLIDDYNRELKDQ